MPYAIGDSYGQVYNNALARNAQDSSNYFNAIAANRQGDAQDAQNYWQALSFLANQRKEQGDDAEKAARNAFLQKQWAEQLKYNYDALKSSTANQAAKDAEIKQRDSENTFSNLYGAIGRGEIPNIPSLQSMEQGRLSGDDWVALATALGNYQKRKSQAFDEGAKQLSGDLTSQAMAAIGPQTQAVATAKTALDQAAQPGWMRQNIFSHLGASAVPDTTGSPEEKAYQNAQLLQQKAFEAQAANLLKNKTYAGQVLPQPQSLTFTPLHAPPAENDALKYLNLSPTQTANPVPVSPLAQPAPTDVGNTPFAGPTLSALLNSMRTPPPVAAAPPAPPVAPALPVAPGASRATVVAPPPAPAATTPNLPPFSMSGSPDADIAAVKRMYLTRQINRDQFIGLRTQIDGFYSRPSAGASNIYNPLSSSAATQDVAY